MSIAVDTNILLYASDSESPFHKSALAFLEERSTGRELLYLPWPVIMGYLRIATHGAIFKSPMTPEAAHSNIAELLSMPHCRPLGEGPNFWPCYEEISRTVVIRGNLVPDAHIAAILLEHGVRDIATNDSDFKKFESLRVHNPLTRTSHQ
ncbi:MAG: PIN domain-containing protein [Thermoanaerobaculales bacterium]|nr:PIN domain-containing protein [Thermoanaerobaculales bacterium]